MAVLPSLNNLRALLQRVIFVPIVYGFISLLPMFLSGWENSDRLADRLFSTIRSKENMFDFIVVGGGTAGALVANRLAEHYTVLLVEAAGTPSPFQTIPALALKFLNHPQTDWSHKTVPQRNACLNSINQQSSWSAGRGLGGSTNINFMTHLRGHPMDYEKWAEITGDPSWGYSGVLPYFKRYETFSGTSNDPEAHGHDGEFRIRKPSYVGLSEDWIRAGQELGYPFVDLNGRHEEGFGILQYPMYKGIRQSTYAAFLLPMHKSPRLTIRRYALVRKVLFRDMNNMAYGVEYVRHGRIETAVATKEVILSAGTLGSSKLLMLSGVGPRAHLEELGIPVRSELPVGRNLQDHLAVHLGPFFIKEPKSFLFDRDVTPENIVRWLFLGTGPITTTGYIGAASIASNAAKSRGEGNWPDIHLVLHGQAIHQGYTDAFAYAYSLQEDELMQYYNNAIGRDSFHIYVIGSRPTSTGQVLLSGASIGDPLVINPKYLEDGANGDFQILMEGVKAAFNIANTSMFQRLGTEFTQTKLPGCHEFELGTDAYWECYIRRFTLTTHNPVGTVTLGAVVDPALRVRGTRGLRVIDASIQPTIVSTATAATTLMIAEKGVDFILKDHGIPDRDTDLFDVIFGKNGFFKRNPILKILQREFDTLNPLRALFKPLIGSAHADNYAKERFTRDGRVDNPFLQVISSVFGNAGKVQGDNNVDSTLNVDVNLKNEKKINEASLSRRSTESLEEEKGEKVNVISKSQWVLQPAIQNPSPKPSVEQINHHASISIPINKINSKDGISDLNITEIPKKKCKGGKRYALLQKILKEQEQNAMANITKKPSFPQSTTTTKIPTTESTTTFSPNTTQPHINSTLKSIVQVVKFEKASVSENEISVENDSMKNINSTAVPLIVAKQVNVIPKTVDSLSPINYSLPSSNGHARTTPSPLTQLLNSLSSFEAFMNSLSKQVARPATTVAPVKVSQSHYVFGSNNSNVLSFLTPPNNKNNSSNNTPLTNSKEVLTTGHTSNPFAFLFGSNKAAAPSYPSTNAITSNVIGPLANTTRSNKIDFFSSWFKPKQNQESQSSWFKPFDKPLLQPSSTSWFKPFSFHDKSSASSTWFRKPASFNENKSAWFKPSNFITQPITTAAPTASTTASPPKSDPFGNLFELFFGGLKKHERSTIFNTLDTMLQAGESLADILGSSSGSGKNSSESSTRNSDNIFEQIAKGKREIEKNQHDKTDEDVTLLKSLIALNEVLKSQGVLTQKPSMTDNKLDSTSTLKYTPTKTETAPIHILIPITTNKSESETESTTQFA